MCETVFKVLVIGDPKVGKTSMVARYCLREWMPNYKATVGADYAVKSIKWSVTQTVRLQIWDIAGQDTYRAMTRTYYRGASGCIIMFDLTDRSTFEQAVTWKKDLDEKVRLPNGDNLPTVLVGNKEDLSERIVVTNQDISRMANDCQFSEWITTSVKQNKNITEAFCQLVQHMLEQEHTSNPIDEHLRDENDSNGLVLSLHKVEHTHNNRCCPSS